MVTLPADPEAVPVLALVIWAPPVKLSVPTLAVTPPAFPPPAVDADTDAPLSKVIV